VRKTLYKGQIPFDSNGDQIRNKSWVTPTEFRDNNEFDDELTFSEFAHTQNSAYAIFHGRNSARYFMFFNDFEDVVQHLISGKLLGSFAFRNHGGYFGVVLVRPATMLDRLADVLDTDDEERVVLH